MALDKIVLESKVQEWGDKCAEYAETHGEENPDFLYEYGKALFAVAKQNSSLVDSQKMEEKQLPLENPNVKIANFEELQNGGDEDEEEGEADANQEEEQEEEEEEAEEEEQEDDFTSAFQVVDLARVLYEKKTISDENDAKLARTRELLGDISLEDDNAEQAVEDYTAAIELKRKIHGKNSGEVSEAEFMLSLAYDAAGKPYDSLKHLKLAAEAAEAAKLPSAGELTQRAKDVEQDLELNAKLEGKDTQEAKEATKESISGRAAIANAVQSMVSNANDISQFARKRKRDDVPKKNEASKRKSE